MPDQFVFPIPDPKDPRLRCPHCRLDLYQIDAILLQGEEAGIQPRKKRPDLNKLLHTCPHCKYVLGVTGF